jgi:hypothetical protein
MSHDVSDALFEVVDGVVVGVEVTGAIPLTIEITMCLQYIVAMNGNQELDTVLMSVVHHIIKTIQNFIAIPLCRTVSFQTRKTIDLGSLWTARLPYSVVENKSQNRIDFLPSSQTRRTLTPASCNLENRVFC